MSAQQWHIACRECGTVRTTATPPRRDRYPMCRRCLDAALLRAVVLRSLWLRPGATVKHFRHEPEGTEEMAVALKWATVAN